MADITKPTDLSTFDYKKPTKVIGSQSLDWGSTLFTVDNGGQKFSFRPASKQAYDRSKLFDPNADFKIINRLGITSVLQGRNSFAITSPEALTDPTDPQAISPNAAPNQNLPRVPRRPVQGGSLLGNSASRAVSAAGRLKSSNPSLLKPMIAGY